ncbi:MAG TPA: metallopeptidase TldD-related protein [Bryobacteraceae bacterium]|nr:metallopeptidase TldD-related protein [Bryobacteraceae bacterium]
MKRAACCVLFCVVALLAQAPKIQTPAQDDPLLRAMKDEIKRVSELIRLRLSLDPPYYTEYRVEDTVSHSITAELGALVEENDSAFRVPSVEMRVGTAKFDNTDHVYSQAYAGTRYDGGRMPLDNDYLAFRQVLWLATDRAYKTAEDAIARKRSSLKNMSQPDALPDFSPAPVAHLILPIERKPFASAAWKSEVIRLSALLGAYPKVFSSAVEMHSSQSTNYVVNSEGTELRTPEDLAYVRVAGRGLAPDGTRVRDAQFFQAFNTDGLPSEDVLAREIKALGDHVSELSQAPAGETYDGPVLFEAPAAAQLFGQLLGDNLKMTRKPVSDPGRPSRYSPSELENKIGSRILPDWMDVVDDPTQTQYQGRTLLGHYLYDMEGVAPQPLPLVEKGVLKSFLLTRTPLFKEYPGSNGHARMTGAYGTRSPGFGNLFIRVSQTTPAADMKKKLMDLCRQANKPYGILVRKLDYPSTASIDELERVAQASGGSHAVVPPLLAYKIYPDGREELVRGLLFQGVSVRSLKDIVAASDENYVFDLIDSNAPFALVGAGSFTTTASIIAPAMLFEELELQPAKEETPQPPIVPPPTLTGQPSKSARTISGPRRSGSGS